MILMIALLSAAVSIGTCLGLKRTFSRAGIGKVWISHYILMAVGSWTLSLVTLVRLLQTPGAGGPVQYWHNDAGAMIMFNLRVATYGVLIFICAPVFLFALVRFVMDLPAWETRGKLSMAAAPLCYLAAVVWLHYMEFFPLV